MAIKVNIPSGQNTATVSGLHQWDYGQVLEIESVDLGNMIGEVHFACPSMSEAIVVSCNFADGLGSVTIPDECLEQSSTINAWIYEINGTQGRTRKGITIPVTPRMRPSASRDIPTEISNRYTQLITEVNEAIDKLENGETTVKKAETATQAYSATTAGNASTANYAITAENATVLSPNRLTNSDGDRYVWKIDSAGVYAVSFIAPNIGGYYTAFIIVSDLSNYTYGTKVNISSKEASLHYVYDDYASEEKIGLVVYYPDLTNKIAISRVYKLADI